MPPDRYKYFRIEGRELLERLGRAALELEKSPAGTEPVLQMLRDAHTLKGAARVVGQAAIAERAHAIEGHLEPWRDGGEVLAACISALLAEIDGIQTGLAALDPVAPGHATPLEPVEAVRVDLQEVDALLEGVLELGVQLAALREAAGAVDPSLGARFDVVQRELDNVREGAGRLRMLPASSMFGALERGVRDAADALGRSVRFETSGGEERVDGHVLMAARDALLHVVRNAVAHGIESPPQRTARGKAAAGLVRLEVARRGHNVHFICQDDGGGIDVAAVARVAARRGLEVPPQLTMSEAVRLLQGGGISTAGQLTELSGRAVGLDVLRATAARLRGEVFIESQAGLGTRVELHVPVSMAAVAVLMVQAGDLAVALPMDSVRATSRLVSGQVVRSAAGATLVHETRAMPFASLSNLLGRPPGAGDGVVAVLQSGDAWAALGVDRLLGPQRVVMRRLPALAGAPPLLAGASIGEDGRACYVLDVAALLAAAREGGTAPVVAPQRAPRPILVVDDSLTTRMLEQSILESAGYNVVLATSGEEGLQKARAIACGLFLVDIEMPGMDGFEFLQHVRQDAALRDTPAIMVSSRNEPQARSRGRELGAVAHVVKSEFDQVRLIGMIRELLGS